MSVGSFGPDGDIEALVVDRYLESLLARQPMDPDGISPELAMTARRLADSLPRYHPSFRFEEELAARLAAVAGRIGSGEVIAFPGSGPAIPRPGDRPFAGRPAVIGGVLTSAALSLAGAAFVAWRWRHAQVDPMSRAVRAAARARLV